MASSEIMRAMTRDGSARVLVINGTALVQRAAEIHRTSPTATVAMGRLLCVTSMLGSLMGEKIESLTVGIQSNGAAGKLLCVSDYYGNVRGYMQHPDADLPVGADGRVQVGRLVGEGILYVARDNGHGEPHTGTIRLKSGEIAEDIAAYYAESEQIPTVCALGVLMGENGICRAAGGVLIQLLPFPAEETVARLEENAARLTRVSELLDRGASLRELMDTALDGIPYDPYDTIDVDYLCTCSRERMRAGIISLGEKEINALLDQQESGGKPRELTAVCRFCNSQYVFSEQELKVAMKAAMGGKTDQV